MSSSCIPECRLCTLIGCLNSTDRDVQDVARSLDRARSGEFDAVVFSPSIFESPLAFRWIDLALERGLEPVAQLPLRALQSASSGSRYRERAEKFISAGAKLHLVLRSDDTWSDPDIDERSVYYTLVPVAGTAVIPLLETLPRKVRKSLHFHYAPFVPSDPLRIPTSRVFKQVESVREAFPDLVVRTPFGQEVWDSRIHPDLCLEPNLPPTFEHRIRSSEMPKISVIIPSYNSALSLRNTVRHLLAQDLPRARYEIIVVDDGSGDDSIDVLRSFVAPESSSVNFKYIYFPRPRSRRMGDGQFRAGIARNLGVKNARGEILCFLDADIITPPDYLRTLIERHREWDVVQSIRHHLKEGPEKAYITYSDVDPAKDVYIRESAYWGPFFETKNWESIPFFWKYTCTYALSLPTELFKRVGWFKRTFVFYGFEDTDLGYRLAAAGGRFFLNPVVTYHLSPGKNRSEDLDSSFERQRLLSKTAKIFYLNTLDPKIYLHLRTYMGGEVTIQRALREIFAGGMR